MEKRPPYPRDVFCVEGHWSSNLRDRSTVEHSLELLADLRIIRKYYYAQVGTDGELWHLLRKWGHKGYADYGIAYLAFHGRPGGFYLDDRFVELDELAEQLEGRCGGRIVHLSCCGTMGIDRRRLTRFLRTTGALLVSGYTTDVDWVDTAAFEIMLFRDFQRRKTPKGIRDFIARDHPEVEQLSRRLRWRMEFLRPDEK